MTNANDLAHSSANFSFRSPYRLFLIWPYRCCTVVLCLAALAQQQTIYAQSVDGASVALIEETIKQNTQLVSSYEVVAQVKEDGVLHLTELQGGGRVPRKREPTRRFWYSDGRQRQETNNSEVLTQSDTGDWVAEPFERIAVFDKEFRSYKPNQKLGEIWQKNMIQADLMKSLRFGYIAFGVDIRTDLGKASKLSIGPDSTSVEFDIGQEGSLSVELRNSNAFLIESATAYDEQKRVVGYGHVTGYYSIPGPIVMPKGWTREIFEYEDNKKKLVDLYSVEVDYKGINQPIEDDLFTLSFPPGTLVNDHVKGTTYVVGGDSAEPDSRLPLIAFISLLVLTLSYVAYKRRAK